MSVIGLTGGIATGKSSVEVFFRELGIAVHDADVIGRTLIEPSTEFYQRIVERYGQSICLPSNKINRIELARILFEDPVEKKWLESLLHAPILATLKQFTEQETGSPYTIVSIPLLAEHPIPKWLDTIAVIICPPQIQVQRLLIRQPNLSLYDVKRRISQQATTNERLSIADYIIHNDGSVKDLAVAVKALHQQLCQ